MGRIFHVRINLDEVSADLNTLVDDKERGEWLRGFMAGASGGANRFVDTSPSYLGWQHGSSARGHAEKFHERQAEYGAMSAKARVDKYGTSQPSKVARTTLDGGSNDSRTTLEPNSNLSNNPIIHKENKPKTNKPRNQDSPEAQCLKRHSFRIKGGTLDKKYALMEAIKILGIEEADRQLGAMVGVWAGDLLARIIPPPPARPQAPPLNLDMV